MTSQFAHSSIEIIERPEKIKERLIRASTLGMGSEEDFSKPKAVEEDPKQTKEIEYTLKRSLEDYTTNISDTHDDAGVDKTSVSLTREIKFPGEENVLDQLVRVRDGRHEIVRISKYEHGCSTAFRVNDKLEISEYEDLQQGIYWLTLSHYDRVGENERVTKRLPIKEPISFKDNCSPSEKTYLYQGHDSKVVFWFSQEESEDLQLNLLRDNKDHPEHDTIRSNTMLHKHITQLRDQNKETYDYATPVPTFLHLSDDLKFIVFSQH